MPYRILDIMISDMGTSFPFHVQRAERGEPIDLRRAVETLKSHPAVVSVQIRMLDGETWPAYVKFLRSVFPEE
jgi:hypothetical protein